jgi:hypothetical protein
MSRFSKFIGKMVGKKYTNDHAMAAEVKGEPLVMVDIAGTSRVAVLIDPIPPSNDTAAIHDAMYNRKTVWVRLSNGKVVKRHILKHNVRPA